MMDGLLPAPSVCAEVLGTIGAATGYGLGLGLIFWGLGYGIWLLIDILRREV